FKLNFIEGEKVLCYEPDPNKAKVLYDSKILERCVRSNSRGKKSVEYLVHFYGWNSSWDRFVSENNILPDTAENRQLQRQLAEQAAESLKGKKLKLNKIPAIIKEVVVGNSSNNGSNDDSSAKDDFEASEEDENVDGDDENCDEDSVCNTTSGGYTSDNVLSEQSLSDFIPQTVLNIVIPEQLKLILEKDQETVEVNKHLYSLPFAITVDDILNEYLSNPNFGKKVKEDKQQQRLVLMKEFENSIQIYFNALLKDYLLYNEQEKKQAKEIEASSKLFSQVYGFIHLLRLMVIIPEFVAATTMGKKEMKNSYTLLRVQKSSKYEVLSKH
ncbi:male-specific lethal 3-like isoform X3, partial [Dinothrombium tinctorium]